jgi:predicted nucleic acid-binding protein
MMVLVDTSVWIDHLRNKEPLLIQLLKSNRVLSHPFVRGEIALGHLKQRQIILSALDNLPQAPVAFADEVNLYIESHALFGLGIGLIDVHLLASTQLAINTKLWTRDKRLLTIANRLNLAYSEVGEIK